MDEIDKRYREQDAKLLRQNEETVKKMDKISDLLRIAHRELSAARSRTDANARRDQRRWASTIAANEAEWHKLRIAMIVTSSDIRALRKARHARKGR